MATGIAAVLLGVAVSASADPIGRVKPTMAPPPPTPPSATAIPSETSRAGDIGQLPAPTDLTNTQDVQTCTQFGGFGAGLACKALLPENRLALIWNYKAPSGQITGFHVYRVDEGQRPLMGRTLVGSQTNGPTVKFYIVDPPPPGGYQGVCYAVTAYGAGQESAISPPFCVGAGAVSKTVTLQATSSRSSVQDSDGFTPPNSNLAPMAFSVGYNHTYTTQSIVVVQIGAYSDDQVYRAGVLFDLSGLAYKKIRSATLHLSVDSAWVWNGGGPIKPTANAVTDHYNSCAANISVGVDRWWQHSDWINATTALSPGPANGPDVTFDVTSIVANWAGGQPNFGFVLEGANESLTIHSNDGCVSSYVPSSAVLVVQYE
jgi:hypothetical protein